MPAPIATYRVQLGPHLSFLDLHALAPYLDRLGVSHGYTSPILTARAGSTHGYDICRHDQLNPELGTRDGLGAVAARFASRGMGLIVDFIPNHMGIDAETNGWWRDVLENGPSSPYARFFDIDWLPVKSELRDKVLLPILADQYGLVLERGELGLEFAEGRLTLRYFDRRLPINPRQAPLVLGHQIERLAGELGDAHADVVELRAILAMLSALPHTTETTEAAIAERQRSKEEARERLAALAARSTPVRQHVDEVIRAFNGRPGVPGSFDALHALLEVQPYRLASWRTAFDEINYRRFFDVNDLAGLRMEDPRVFAATHALLLELVAEGTVSGIRIDHPDGLFDPAAYLRALSAAVHDRQPGGVYIVVEKILGRGEQLRDNWPVNGTTGYDLLNVLNGVFVHPDGLVQLRRIYRRFTGWRSRPADTAYASKRFMMRSAMASELNVLARALNRLSENDRRSRDFTLNSLRRALVEVIASFPVYRTYVTDEGASPADVEAVDTAIEEARRRNPVQEPSVFEFIRHSLLPEGNGGQNGDRLRSRSLVFAQKFQQYTAPVVAKGVEDTAFYTDVLLLSANEVGGDLRYRARPIAEFHQENARRLARWPLGMTTASTHDTKRGEDARARINVISEVPDEWRAHLLRWSAINEHERADVAGLPAPDRNDEWLFYQSLVGAWPAESLHAPIPKRAPTPLVDRMQAFMRKALKEAKRHTSWLHENAAYETGVEQFVATVLASGEFLSSFIPFERRLAWFGMLASLSQLVLRLGAPGVPDIYQGSELWNLALVDPDNRRPVDFAHRARLLEELEPLLSCRDATPARARQLAQLLDDWHDGRVKLFTMAATLRLRRAMPEVFVHGEYEPLGDADDPHLIAFNRHSRAADVVVVGPRFVAQLLRGAARLPFGIERWRTASVRLPRRLASARFHNVFTGEVVEPVVYKDVPWLLAGSVFQSWPVALLVAQ